MVIRACDFFGIKANQTEAQLQKEYDDLAEQKKKATKKRRRSFAALSPAKRAEYEDPGKDVSAFISTNSHELVRIWMGDVSLSKAMSKDRITVLGDGIICPRFKNRFPLSTAAQVARPRREV